jgi:acetate kinase
MTGIGSNAAHMLVVNAGSSSVKFAVYRAGALELQCRGRVEGLGQEPRFTAEDSAGVRLDVGWGLASGPGDHKAAIAAVVEWIFARFGRQALRAAGHRVVHGGTAFAQPVRIDEAVLDKLEKLAPLAPLHQPHNLAAMRALMALAPDLPQVACFDTAFHRTMSETAARFALPRVLSEAGIRRYGFHGLSYESIAGQLAAMGPALARGRAIVAHLGNGASLCAMLDGKSVDTTMGLTALDGVPMGTRCGALDPGVVLYLMREMKLSLPAVEDLLYNRSGLLGVSDLSGDMRTLLESPKPAAAEAVALFVHRVGREIGALAASLGGVDLLVFTGGIGERSPVIRGRISAAAAWLGVAVDEAANAAGGPRISSAASRVAVYALPTDEERVIAAHTLAVTSRTAG